MSGWAMLAILIGCVAVAWCWLKIWEILAGPPDKAEPTEPSTSDWWYWNGQDWKPL